MHAYDTQIVRNLIEPCQHKRKQHRNRRHMRPYPYDLFGEIAITWPEVYDWVRENAPRWADCPRMDWYIKNWNVVQKAQREKETALNRIPN